MFYTLHSIQSYVFMALNKVNDPLYSYGIVNLSKYTPRHHERSLLLKGLGFCPNPEEPDIGNIANDCNGIMRKGRHNLFFTAKVGAFYSYNQS